MKRGFMQHEVLILLGLACSFLAYSLWIYAKAENTDYAKLSSEVREIQGQAKTLIERAYSAESLSKDAVSKVVDLELKVEAAVQQVDFLQEHCAKLREAQVEIREKALPKSLNVNVRGAIPVEVYPGTGKEKLKKGLGRGVKSVIRGK